ncbi:type III-A CRISPR-associated RAMP protein Csm3 [Fodinisporobacter ferrooxydans]|uniref:CRISPR system Cms endoribonuclease Csm3 n=1 Tax=Fodinisporobacter ferrooxydans TaxID=2901836 RepID=A0ABY4CTC1_9BACL|nr:type III-A CRISPR-associated RAMP protein Csm3 [Alicyclobacillaceae bacterium MYW30-H2]
MKLKQFTKITGIIHCETGLKIGGTKDSIDIGGVDAPIIRHPITRVPYIPGSSLKGKMRSLLESIYSSNTSIYPCGCGTCKVCINFGSLKSTSPTRVLVRDAHMAEKSLAVLKNANEESGMNFVEVKTENFINRSVGKAEKPRVFERVPAETEFHFEISIRIFENDLETDVVNFVLEGLKLVEHDYLGGSGGRGYGKVKFKNVVVETVPLQNYKEDVVDPK